jgi:preprotein translocase subunit YajC
MQGYTTILIYVAIFAAMWFLLIRPQQKRDKETKNMRSSVQEGDEIVTIGGIYGKVMSVKEDVLTIEVGADKVKLKVARWAIGKIENKK